MNTLRPFILLLFLVLLASGAFAQTKTGPNYGKPVAQIFEVRPAIAAEVKFAKTGEVCDVLVMSHPILFGQVFNDENAEPIKDEALDEILKELVPMDKRGYFVMGRHKANGLLETYQNVDIYRAKGDKDNWKYAQITWQIKPCGRAPNEQFKLIMSK